MNELEYAHMPKYAQLMKVIKDQIVNHELKPGSIIPTRSQMMKQYDLSLSTVTRAIAELERQGWLISRQGSGTTVNHKLPSKESIEKRKTIGFLCPSNNVYALDVARELCQEAYEHNFKIVTMLCPDNIDVEMEYARYLLDQAVDALIWSPVPSKTHIGVASLFNRNGIPAIVCEKIEDNAGPLSICVRSDHYGGMKKVLNHLHSLGHERIAYAGPTVQSTAIGVLSDRWNAYRDFMRERNMWDPDRLVFKPSMMQEWHVHSHQIENRFKRSDAPTAIVGYNDSTVLDMARCLQSLGFRIPDEISIAGNGDEAASQFSEPRLTTVSMCHAEYVDTLVRTLLKMFHPEKQIENSEIVVPQRLINRGSTKAVGDFQLNKN
jgi:DNA-binding LacI/PurR family transcriptional regulator